MMSAGGPRRDVARCPSVASPAGTYFGSSRSSTAAPSRPERFEDGAVAIVGIQQFDEQCGAASSRPCYQEQRLERAIEVEGRVLAILRFNRPILWGFAAPEITFLEGLNRALADHRLVPARCKAAEPAA